MEDIQKRIDKLLPKERDYDLDANVNTWSELEAMEEIMDDHDRKAIVLPQLSSNIPSVTVNRSISIVIGEESTNTLPRGSKSSQKMLRRKFSDPEMRLRAVNQADGTRSNLTAQSPASKNMSTSGTFSGNLRRDSDASISSGQNIHIR